jgi:hypothetical protein
MLTQIGSGGAIVVMKDTPFTASRIIIVRHGTALRQYKGVFRVGQHLCNTGPSFIGVAGELYIGMPHDYLATPSNAPGAFLPDTAPRNCGQIATLTSFPGPNSGWAAAKHRIAQPLASPHRLATCRILAVLLLVGLFVYLLRRQNTKPRKPVPLPAMQQAYAGFAVREGDFEAEGNTVYRVNSDGYRVNLQKWHFDNGTGEFFRIDRRVKGHVIFTTKPYSARFIEFTPTIAVTAFGWIGTIACGVFALMLGEMAIRDGGYPTIWAPVFTVVMVVGICLLATQRSEAKIGPEPLKHAAPEFGTQQPHGTAADEGMI